MRKTISRREFLAGGGAIVVGFSLAACSIGGNDNKSGSAGGGAGTIKAPQASPVQQLQNVTGSSVAIATPSSAAAPVGTPEAHAVGGADQVDSWLAIRKNGVTLYTGKVELGQGIMTSLSQIVAEELDVPLEQVSVVQGQTGHTPDQGYTAGS
jgi:nicotinate dehydrogenase subunit B